MSKITWSDVIASIDLSDKPVRNPKRLSHDEITDIKTKCNPKYDLTILDLICTIEGYQETLRKAREAIITTIKGIDNKKIIPASADDAIELWRHKQQISNALAAIDKVIRGLSHEGV